MQRRPANGRPRPTGLCRDHLILGRMASAEHAESIPWQGVWQRRAATARAGPRGRWSDLRSAPVMSRTVMRTARPWYAA
jgi:hypothetical protein